jgi:hypothetical protein
MNSTLASVRTFPPSESEGWTLTTIERTSKYWLTAEVGKKDEALFERGVKHSWQWAEPSHYIRWFSDGERRYGKQLWKWATVRLNYSEVAVEYEHFKVWRQGLEVAIKIKASQGKPKVEWLKSEHPFTAISPVSQVHANHNEALNSSIRRRCSAYRRRQNHYAKTVAGLQRTITVQRLIHNWIRPHWSLAKRTTPAMAMGFCQHLVSMEEFLTIRGYSSITN